MLSSDWLKGPHYSLEAGLGSITARDQYLRKGHLLGAAFLFRNHSATDHKVEIKLKLLKLFNTSVEEFEVTDDLDYH